MKYSITILAVLMITLLLLETGSWGLSHTRFVYDPTDIQTVSVLKLKLQRFAAEPNPRAIFIGDSVINGATLGEHGDPLWRQHTIAANFEKLSAFKSTLNIGFNGALPCDLYYLYHNYLKNIPTQLLVFDIGIRSFAKDFESEATALSRPWLKDFTWSAGLLTSTKTNDPRSRLETQLSLFLLNHSSFFALRDFLQWRLLEGPISQILPTTIKKWHHPAESEDLAALLPAKARYSRIEIQTDGRQAGCLRGLLQEASQANTPTLIVQSREKPSLENTLLTPEKFAYWREKLKSLILFTPNFTANNYIEIIPALKPEMYLDHIHVNSQGNTLIAKAIAKKLITGQPLDSSP